MRPDAHFSGDDVELLFQQHSGYALIQLDPEGKVVRWFSGTERVFGYSADEIIGQPSSVLLFPKMWSAASRSTRSGWHWPMAPRRTTVG